MSNGVRYFLSVLATMFAGTPVWIFLLAQHLLQPDGFWQKVVMYGAGLYVLGGIQFILTIALVVALVIIWKS